MKSLLVILTFFFWASVVRLSASLPGEDKKNVAKASRTLPADADQKDANSSQLEAERSLEVNFNIF